MKQTERKEVRLMWVRTAVGELRKRPGVRQIDGRPLGYRFRSLVRLSFVVTACLLVSVATSNGQQVSVYVDSTESAPGYDVPVRVLMENDEPVASIIVPLNYRSDRLFPDSVSFEGSVVSPDHQYLATYSSDSNLVRILILPDVVSPMPFIYDPGGLLATIWFSVSPFAEEGMIVLDTTYTLDSIGSTGDFIYFYTEELQASDLEGNQISPAFTPGSIVISSPDFDK